MVLDSSVFALNTSLAKKNKKNLDGNMAKNWTSIEIKFRIELNLDSLIFTLNNSFDKKLKIK